MTADHRTEAITRWLQRAITALISAFILPLLLAPFAAQLSNAKLAANFTAVNHWLGLMFVILGLDFARRRFTFQDLHQAPWPHWAMPALLGTTLLAYLAATLSLYFKFEINAHDFSTYDAMMFYTRQSLAGGDGFMWTPFCPCMHFMDHPNYIMLALLPMHAWFQSPLFLLLAHPILIWLGVIPVTKIFSHYTNAKWLSWLAALAFLGNGWTASILNYGFHVEAFYVAIGASMILFWVQRKHLLFWCALMLFLTVKEDAPLLLLAWAMGIMLWNRVRWGEATVMATLALIMIAFNFALMQPIYDDLNATLSSRFGFMTQQELPHLGAWRKYGSSPSEILWNFLTHPVEPLGEILSSHWFVILGAMLFLPLLAPVPLMALLPSFIVLGTSEVTRMRSFGLYYSAIMLPFLFWALAEAHQRLKQITIRQRAWLPTWLKYRHEWVAAALVLFIWGKGVSLQYSMPLLSKHSELKSLINAFDAEAGHQDAILCIQGALTPHLPMSARILPLNRDCLQRPQALAVVDATVNLYPYSPREFEAVLADMRELKRTASGIRLMAPKL